MENDIKKMFNGILDNMKLDVKDALEQRAVDVQNKVDSNGWDFKVELVGDLDSDNPKDTPRIQPVKADIEKANKYEFGSATENIKPSNFFLKLRNEHK